MKKYFFILISFLAFFTACEDCENESTTKVGFYTLDASGTDNGSYNLYVDNQYRGRIQCLKNAPVCGDSALLYLMLDGSKHEVDVKDDAGQYLNSEYIKVSEDKCASGAGKNSGKVKNGRHGSSFSKKTGDDCATMCFIK